jgi:hypothetical protein
LVVCTLRSNNPEDSDHAINPHTFRFPMMEDDDKDDKLPY